MWLCKWSHKNIHTVSCEPVFVRQQQIHSLYRWGEGWLVRINILHPQLGSVKAGAQTEVLLEFLDLFHSAPKLSRESKLMWWEMTETDYHHPERVSREKSTRMVAIRLEVWKVKIASWCLQSIWNPLGKSTKESAVLHLNSPDTKWEERAREHPDCF